MLGCLFNNMVVLGCGAPSPSTRPRHPMTFFHAFIPKIPVVYKTQLGSFFINQTLVDQIVPLHGIFKYSDFWRTFIFVTYIYELLTQPDIFYKKLLKQSWCSDTVPSLNEKVDKEDCNCYQLSVCFQNGMQFKPAKRDSFLQSNLYCSVMTVLGERSRGNEVEVSC